MHIVNFKLCAMKVYLNYLIAASLVLLYATNGLAQNTDLEKLNFKGKVKEITEQHYQPTDSSGIDNGDPGISYKNYYSEDGNKIEDVRYNPDGTINKQYKYHCKSGVRTLQEQFDGEGKVIRIIKYIYDSKGNCTEDNSYGPEGDHEKKYTYLYDDNGNIIEDKSFSNEGVLGKIFKYKYDDSGLKIENIRYYPDGSFDKKITYKYDDNRNVIEELCLKENGETKWKNTYQYKYDKTGNWIRMVEFQDGKASYIIERGITYF